MIRLDIGLIERNIPPKIHNLLALAKKSNIYDKMRAEQKDFLRELNPLNIEGRYPENMEKLSGILTESKCVEIIGKTEEMSAWISNQL